jgi:hypothetical protein
MERQLQYIFDKRALMMAKHDLFHSKDKAGVTEYAEQNFTIGRNDNVG